jgi:hypothetical protein
MRRRGMSLLLATRNAVAFVFAALAGYIVSSFLPEGAWFILAYLLITYHLFLLWLVLSADYEKDLTPPIGSTILVHLLCLILVVFVGIGLRHVPFVGLIRYALPAVGIFEIKWLFDQRKKKKQIEISAEKAAADAARAATAVAAAATVDDYQDWLRYLSKPDRPPRKPGMTVEEEYKQWLLARARGRLPVHRKH